MLFQGILGMLSAINGEQFFLECYTPLGEVIFIHTFQSVIFENNIFSFRLDNLKSKREVRK